MYREWTNDGILSTIFKVKLLQTCQFVHLDEPSVRADRKSSATAPPSVQKWNGDVNVRNMRQTPRNGPLVSPRIFEDDFVVVSHRPPPPHGRSVPGYVFVETRRHVSGLPSLSEPEALAIAHAVWCVSRALDSELTPEFVFSAIAGLSVPHFHQHVFVRPFGAPSSVSWNDVDSWDDAPRVDEVELTLLCRRIALGFEDEQ